MLVFERAEGEREAYESGAGNENKAKGDGDFVRQCHAVVVQFSGGVHTGTHPHSQ